MTDESAMTGESIELKKHTLEGCLRRQEEKMREVQISNGQLDSHSFPSPILLSGTQVQQGDGEFLVTMVGSRSCIGKIMDKLETTEEATPLQ